MNFQMFKLDLERAEELESVALQRDCGERALSCLTVYDGPDSTMSEL